MSSRGFTGKVILRANAAATPPDVRRGCAPPLILDSKRGCAPGSGLAQCLRREARTKGVAPNSPGSLTAGQSPASHPAAKP